MVTWKDVQLAKPAFASRVQELFDQGRHKTIATLRADGGPRISGIECTFEDGELRFGSMRLARKGADLRRDPRFALHSPTNAPEAGRESEWLGEAKISGRAVPAGHTGADKDGQPEGEMFTADIASVVITGLTEDATLLRVELWTPTRGLREMLRA
ncbi:MAG: pyridoxamine 5'-phosphate oxidase family protein [Actinomycetia bacterium]|nr:pyridoxamine 5'-phosphate oxidase family protein [Actinomycetes bacterium]